MRTGSVSGDVDLVRSLATSLRETELPAWLSRVLDPPTVAEALRGRMAELVPGALDLTEVRFQDIRARRAWSLRLEVDVVTADGVRPVVLVGQRHLPGLGHVLHPGALLLPELGLSVAVVHDDAALPVLPALLDPARARPLLQSALRDGGQARLRIADVRPRLVRYKPGRRATVTHDLSFAEDAQPDWPRTVVTKTYRDESAASATYAWMCALWESDLRRDGVPRLAEPLGCLAGHRTLLQRAIPGTRTLADIVMDPAPVLDGPSVSAAVEAAADGLVALHRSGVTAGPRRTVAAQAETGESLLRRVGPSLPERTRDDAAALLHHVTLLLGGETQHLVPVHGAFRPDQVLFDGSRPGFLDFDGFGQGEPAQDVSTLVVRLREMVTDDSRRADLTDVFLQRYRTGAALPADRTANWVLLVLTTNAVRSWYRGRADQAALFLDLLVDALDEEW